MWFLAITLTGAAGLALGFIVYVSVRVRRGAFEPTRSAPPFDLEVLDVSDERVTLRALRARASGRLTQNGVWGLRWARGHGRVGRVVRAGESGVAREWTPFEGTLGTGERARIELAAFPSNPRVAFGIEFRSARYESPAGQFTGAICDGPRSTWVLFVHGKRAARPRKPPWSYPILPLARDLGLPCFDVAYRNDPDAPVGDGLHWYGLKEWEDLEAAARYALDHGCENLVPVGYSMGGAIVMSFLYRSGLASRVRGVILDAPVLDLQAAVDAGIHRHGVPRTLIRPGLWIAGRRLGLDWDSVNYLKDARRLEVPILLFHGDSDPVVPVETSDRLARLRSDIVTYVRAPGAGHAQAWNVEPPVYEAAVRAFLGRLV